MQRGFERPVERLAIYIGSETSRIRLWRVDRHNLLKRLFGKVCTYTIDPDTVLKKEHTAVTQETWLIEMLPENSASPRPSPP